MVDNFKKFNKSMFKVIAPQDIISHVKTWSFRIENPHISQCIDWRRTKNESNFGISIPGGWIWQLASILSVLEETRIINYVDFRKKALKILLDAIWWESNLSFHTDDSCSLEHWKIWCWHVWLILNKEMRDEYLLSDDSAIFIEETMKKYEETAKINVLCWWHSEVWVLIVDSIFHSVHANIDWHQLFVYTPELAKLRNTEIAKRIYDEFIKWTWMSLTPDSLLDMLQRKTDLHFKQTLETLAPTLPVYETKHFLNWDIKYLKTLWTINDMYHI